MSSGGLTGVTVVVGSAVFGPGVLPVQLDPTIVLDASGPVKAVGSFAIVLLIGTVLRSRFGRHIDRAVGDVIDQPKVAVFYGILAYGLLVLGGLYANDMLIQTGTIDTPVGSAVFALLTLGVLIVTSIGYVILGTLLTEIWSIGGYRLGPVFGAVISALPWLILPFTAGIIAWLALASFGIGGRTRTWVHTTRAADSMGE